MKSDDPTFFRIGLPDEAVARLLELAEECHAEPAALAAALLIDVLHDDFEAHHAPPGFSPEKPFH